MDQKQANKQPIRKVHVIFKTHLDVGYTDTSSNVLEKYRTIYIPHAIALAKELNRDGKKEFIWTVGSFLVDDYLTHASPKAIAEMEHAICRGDISWHALATTTHTELMDAELLDFSLSLSQNLDSRFGKKTMGGKMTDVPGHTIAMVPALASHGITYLHIGVNCASPAPQVPPIFRWRCNGSEIIVHYSDDYGTPLVIDGFDQAIEYAYTGDNTGPQSAEKICQTMAEIRSRYPGAEVVASTISDFAAALEEIRDSLPIVTEEIGDTWIHGSGTDPVKIGLYEDMLRLKHHWLVQGQMTPQSPFYHDFMTDLLLVAEHTCSVDIKKYLFDFTNWSKSDFQAARQKDHTDISLIPPCYDSLRNIVFNELNIFRNGDTTGSYSFYESSQAEQMGYLTHAISLLPKHLANQATACFAARTPKSPVHWPAQPSNTINHGKPQLQQMLTFSDWRCKVSADGSLSYLAKGNRLLVDTTDNDEAFARPLYEVFDALTVKASQYQYNTKPAVNLAWTEADFCKPGLETVPNLKHRLYSFAVVHITRDDHSLTVALQGDETACTDYGCPRYLLMTYTFGDNLQVQLDAFDKDASRIPEAIWLYFHLHTENPHRWKMMKLGIPISPYDVVKNGNRQMHSVPQWQYDGADGSLLLDALHAPLCAVGGRGLYQLDQKVNSLAHGFYYNLYNNRWGTNFKTWCEDNFSVVYVLTVNAVSCLK